MKVSSSRRFYRPAFEFQRGGPYIKGSAAHKPDLSIAINRPSLQQQQIQQQQQQIILPNASLHSARTPRSSRQKLPVTLDMFTIADDCGSTSFSDVTSLNLSSRKLNNVDIDSLKELKSLIKLDVSDNNLKLEPFSLLEKLEDLDFSCNNLSLFSYEKIQDKKACFSSLKKLNLNFNSIGKSLQYFSNFSNLTILLLTHNNLTTLPQNTNQFIKLEYLDLSFNSLNSDSCFIALAALPSLKTLILDSNNIVAIPKFQFGFDKMNSISLKNNKIESSVDIVSLADLQSLHVINILNNPINVYRKDIQFLQSACSTSNIKLIYSMEQSDQKRAPRKFMNIVRVDNDPLLLPNKELQKKLFPNRNENSDNQQSSQQNEEDTNDEKYDEKKQFSNNSEEYNENDQNKSTQDKVDTDVFMTDFTQIPETPLPPEDDQQNESDIEVRNVWKDIPVIKRENRKRFTSNSSVKKFNDAFKRLTRIVDNPNILLTTSSPRSSYPTQTRTKSSIPNSSPNSTLINDLQFDDDQQSFLPDDNDLDISQFDISAYRYPRPRPNSTRSPYEPINAKSSTKINSSANATLRVPPLNIKDTHANTNNNTARLRKSARANSPTKGYSARKKKRNDDEVKDINIEERLNSNKQLSQDDVMMILQQMERQLCSAESIINQEELDLNLDQTNYSALHKKHESIRSEFVNSLCV